MDAAKQMAKRMKAKGLQRLRWYCQMCEKQCRDENGFKCHCLSESHVRQMAAFSENPDAFVDRFSNEFQAGVLSLLKVRFAGRLVAANTVYQEYISDKEHLHMNATRWRSLTHFVTEMRDSGILRAEESDRGWMVQYIEQDEDRDRKRMMRGANRFGSHKVKDDGDDIQEEGGESGVGGEDSLTREVEKLAKMAQAQRQLNEEQHNQDTKEDEPSKPRTAKVAFNINGSAPSLSKVKPSIAKKTPVVVETLTTKKVEAVGSAMQGKDIVVKKVVLGKGGSLLNKNNGTNSQKTNSVQQLLGGDSDSDSDSD